MIRYVTSEDKEWVLDVSEKVYSGTKFGWVREDAANSFDQVLASPSAIFLRGEKTYFYAAIEPRFCDYGKRDAGMELLVGEGDAGMEPLRIIEYAAAWCKANNVDRLTISSVTSHGFGQLLLKRIGAIPRIVYDVNFKE